MTTSTRFAITYTVKNEADLLPDAIAYHRALGCSKFYVFFDGTTDASRELIGGATDVTCADSLPPVAAEAPEWIRRIAPRWHENMDVRKRINTYTAAQWARRDGVEWLINIDPDELLLLTESGADSAAAVAEFFRPIPPSVDQILVRNLEAIALGPGTGKPFIDCTLFLQRFPLTELLWKISARLLRTFTSSPRLLAWYDYGYYQLRFRGALPRRMRHPLTGEVIPAGYFLGYSNHKALIRTANACDFEFNIHRWQRARRSPRSIVQGRLLHFDLCSPEYFRSKFRQRQGAVLSKDFYCRYMFAQIARELPSAEAQRFFVEQICLPESRVAGLRSAGILVEIDHISRWMRTRVARSNVTVPSNPQTGCDSPGADSVRILKMS